MSLRVLRRACERSLGLVVVAAVALAVVAPAAAAQGPPGVSTPTAERIPADPNDAERRGVPAYDQIDEKHTAALDEAARTGRPTRVVGLTTETADVVAQPDGTVLYTAHVDPVRTDKSGVWRDIDTTLERKPDGTVGPRVALADIVLSGGGVSTPLAVVGHEGKEVGLSWPGRLPEPMLSGDTAVYPNVLSDVDLKITVDGVGFYQVLVVKTRKAAANPALRSIRFGSQTKGTRVTKTELPGFARGPAAREGGARPSALSVVGESGDVLFRGDASRMWDSAGVAPAGARLVGPAENDNAAVMGVEVADSQVTITPDQDFLSDSSTVYPVYIDPYIRCECGVKNRVVLYKVDGQVGDAVWDDTYLKAGYVWDTSQGKWITARSYFTMDIRTVPRAAVIHYAKLHLTVASSYSDCPGRTNVHLTHSINSGISFGNEPVRSDRVGVVGDHTGCPGEGGWSTPGHDGNRGDALSSFLREHRATGIGDTLTFGLFAESESVQTHWRKFRTNPGLTVQYNQPPDRPSSLNAHNGTAALGCVADADATLVGKGDITLRAKLTDPDRHWVRAQFVVYRNNVRQGFLDTAGQPSGGTHQVAVPSAWLTDGGVISWRVIAWDGSDADRLSSPWTGPQSDVDDYCRFTLDVTSPDVPGVESVDGVYPPEGNDVPDGGVGVVGRFKFTPGILTGINGTNDVHRYQWSIDSDAFDNSVAPGPDGTAEIAFTPMAAKVYQLNVRAVDLAGNVSVRRVEMPSAPANYESYQFAVPHGSEPVARWTFDNGGIDVTGNGHDLDFVGGATTVDVAGYTGAGMRTGHTGDAAVAVAPVVDTGAAFSVAGWGRVAQGAGEWTRTAFAIDDTYASPVMLSYRTDDRNEPYWSLGISCSTSTPCVRVAWSDAPAKEGVWTHLAMTVDIATDTACFYVNGVKQTSCLQAANLSATGSDVLLGQLRWTGSLHKTWLGEIDDTEIYDRTLAPPEVATLANVPAEQARYKLDENHGSTTVDSTGGNDGTLYGAGVSWNQDDDGVRFDGQTDVGVDQWADSGTGLQARWGLDNTQAGTGANAPTLLHRSSGPATPPDYVSGRWGSGVALDGVWERLYTVEPPLNTAESYSVAAWVKLDHKNQSATVITKDGNQAYAFALAYDKPRDRWVLRVTAGDSAGTGVTEIVSELAPRANEWAHVAGSYDEAANTARLYVNGVLEGERSLAAPGWNSTGAFVLGRAYWGGQQKDFLAGAVDEVRVYDRAITVEDAHGLWNLGSDVNAELDADVDTRRSFSIAGFARLDQLNLSARAVFSLGGKRTMPVFVGYRGSTGRWQVLAHAGTDAVPVVHEVQSNAPATAGEWAHLAVTFDASTGRLRLYVDGLAQTWMPAGQNPDNHPYATIEHSLLPDTGKLVIGRGTWAGKNVDPWHGAIRDVRIFAGVLDDAWIQAMAEGFDGGPGGGEETLTKPGTPPDGAS